MTLDTSPAALAESVLNLKDIPDEATRIAAIQAFAKSVSSIWVVDAPIVGVGLLLGEGTLKVPMCYLYSPIFALVLWVRKYTLFRTIIQNKDPKKALAEDVEKAQTPAEAIDAQPAPNGADDVTTEEGGEGFEPEKDAPKEEKV